ncbi:ABC transporter substrate-binding protein [Micromonospora sp. NPDC023737]|uniref:ABC transporter substrate-binding protein n=1 Tax=unclassified Micromonospora TaxID=2617518 RepID=UPI0033E5A236
MKLRAVPRLAAVFAISVATMLSGCSAGAGKGSASNDTTWKVGVMPCTSDCGFLRMAQAKGFYKKQGVNVEFVELKSAEQVYPALASGEVDAIEQSPGGLYIAAQRGGLDAKVIGSSMEGNPFAIFANKKYDSLSDLKGKSVGISSPTGLPALVAKLMLKDAGVDWTSVRTVNAGGNPDRYRAVVAGTVDATADATDYIPRAEKDGVNVLGLSADIIPDYPRFMIIAREDSLKKKGELATGYLAGLIEGLRYAYEHPDEAKKVSAEALKLSPDDPMVTFTHDVIVEKKLVDPDGGIDMNKLEYLEKVLQDSGDLKKSIDVKSLVDDSYQQAALKRLEG